MLLSVIDKKILEEVADLHEIPMGAYNIRKNGEGAGNGTGVLVYYAKTDLIGNYGWKTRWQPKCC